jgi:Immunity protein 7
VFEYHGWVAIRETAGLDDNDELLRQQVAEIQERLAELGDYGLLDLRWIDLRCAN